MNLSNFAEGTTSEAILIARVNGTPANGKIDNAAQIQLPNQAPVVTPPVEILVPKGTPNWNVSKVKSSPAGEPAPDTVVSYHMELASGPVLGNVGITTATFVDSFPVGAVIDDPEGGTVDYTTHTITWVRGPFEPSIFQSSYFDIKLHYPSTPRVPGEPAFSPGDIVVNNFTGNFTYDNGSRGTATAHATDTLAGAKAEITVAKTAPATYVQGRDITWGVSGTNTGNVPIPNPILTDSPLPTGVSNFYLYFNNSSGLPSVITDYQQLVNGVWKPLATYNPIVVYPWGPYHLDPAATGVRAIPETGVANVGQQYGYFKLWGTVTGAVGSTIANCAQGTGDPSVTATPVCTSTTVTAPTAALGIVKSHTFTDTGSSVITPGTVFDWNFAINNDQSKGSVSKFTVGDTLPKGFTFQSVQCIGRYGLGGGYLQALSQPCGSIGINNQADFPKPVVTKHADGTTGLVWTVDLSDGHFGITELPSDSALLFHLNVVVDNGTAVGSYTNHVEVQTSGPVTCLARAGTLGTDPYDYNGDGSTTDATCNSSDNVDVAAAAIIDASKWDHGTDGLPDVTEASGAPSATCPEWNDYTRYPCVAQTTPGGPLSYRFKLQNIGNVDATNYVMYDILPTTGDTGVSQTLAGSQRGTDWSPVLTGPITVLTAPAAANPVIEYNLTTNPCRPELNAGSADGSWQASCDNTWYTAAQITDWSTVHSFRVKAFQPTAAVPNPGWNPLDEFDLQANLQAPVTAPTSTTTPLNLSVAWNSFAHREFRLNADGTTARLLPSEPRKVGVIIPFVLPNSYAVGDYVWYDANGNGVQDAGEKPVPNVKVTLVNADGSAVTDASGNPLASTTTDSAGHYVFDNLAPGDYKVVFANLPAGFETTASNNSGNATATDDSNPPGRRHRYGHHCGLPDRRRPGRHDSRRPG